MAATRRTFLFVLLELNTFGSPSAAHSSVSRLLCALSLSCALVFVVASCRDDKQVLSPDVQKVITPSPQSAVTGFYLLNEGNMGSNKASLDFFDISTGVYSRNIYGQANPTMVQELGDVGNDISVYGSRLYAVINCSNFIEVMDVRTARHLGSVNVPNCRYLAFDGQYGYVTSYAGPVQLNPSYEQLGYVAKFDTASFQVVATCNVGFQPDGLAVVGDKLFVANSGGYMAPDYDNTISVIDLVSFTELYRIAVAPNLHRLCPDSHGHLWVSSRGDYYDVPPRLFCLDVGSSQVIDTVDVSVSNFTLCGDSLYTIGSRFNYESYESVVSYAIVDVLSRSVVSDKFITDGTDAVIEVPYGIAVHPQSHDIFVTDARNYVSPGTLYCFSPEGTLRWKVSTGDIPAHFAFVY